MASKKWVIELINESIYLYTISKSYENNASEWSKKYDLILIKEAIEIGKNKYLIYNENEITDESSDKYLNKLGITYRDLKPQNILIDEAGKINISDFEIVYYDPDNFVLTCHTVKHDRLANYDFSAPEQRNSKYISNATTDIYAFGQIIQWLVFGETHKETNHKKLIKKYNTKKIKQLDKIVDKCLSNDPKDRYQSFEEMEVTLTNV